MSKVYDMLSERKYNENEIDFLVNEFALTRNKAVNLLRKMDLKQAVRHLVNSWFNHNTYFYSFYD